MSESISPEILSCIRAQMGLLRVASATDKVYKDECAFSFDTPYAFDTPYSKNGLYVNLKTFQGYGERFFKKDAERTHSVLYLHELWKNVPVAAPKDHQDPTKLAIGVEGGFMTEKKFETVKSHSLVVLYDGRVVSIPLPNPSLPEFISNVCYSIINHDGMKLRMQADSWVDDQVILESKYARGLIQLSNNKKISNDPSTWKCEVSGATENLWLNLSTGFIGGGRKNWDGSGGSGAALAHFEETGKLYPLCVKLGTITPLGADVYSYAEDEDTMVSDPLLAQHLAHWGIDIMTLEKTDKTMDEMQVQANLKYDWNKIFDDDGETCNPLHGPGYKGLVNMGATCYMNSVLQVLLSIPEVQERYGTEAAYNNIVNTCGAQIMEDFSLQLSKIARGLYSDRYIAPAPLENNGEEHCTEQYKITPVNFKNLVGKNHREFSGGLQQDASEYFQHLLGIIKRSERNDLVRLTEGLSIGSATNVSNKSTAALFDYLIEKRMECVTTKQVKYICNESTMFNIMELRIPTDFIPKSTAGDANESKKMKVDESDVVIPFQACLDAYFESCVVSIRNPSVSNTDNVDAVVTSKMATFPRYLLVKLGRYYVDDKWRQCKVSASIPVPEMLDLSGYKASGGLQSGEVEMEEATQDNAAPSAGVPLVPDENLVATLVSMGFSENGCKRAALATHNADAETAMNWIFAHMEGKEMLLN